VTSDRLENSRNLVTAVTASAANGTAADDGRDGTFTQRAMGILTLSSLRRPRQSKESPKTREAVTAPTTPRGSRDGATRVRRICSSPAALVEAGVSVHLQLSVGIHAMNFRNAAGTAIFDKAISAWWKTCTSGEWRDVTVVLGGIGARQRSNKDCRPHTGRFPALCCRWRNEDGKAIGTPTVSGGASNAAGDVRGSPATLYLQRGSNLATAPRLSRTSAAATDLVDPAVRPIKELVASILVFRVLQLCQTYANNTKLRQPLAGCAEKKNVAGSLARPARFPRKESVSTGRAKHREFTTS